MRRTLKDAILFATARGLLEHLWSQAFSVMHLRIGRGDGYRGSVFVVTDPQIAQQFEALLATRIEPSVLKDPDYN